MKKKYLIIICIAVIFTIIYACFYYYNSEPEAEEYLLNSVLKNDTTYYLVYTESDLYQIANGLNPADGNYILMNDIHLTSSWQPIGTKKNPFCGSFNGENYCISNIIVESSKNRAFFGYAKNATIENLNLKCKSSHFFPVIGVAFDCEIHNCFTYQSGN